MQHTQKNTLTIENCASTVYKAAVVQP